MLRLLCAPDFFCDFTSGADGDTHVNSTWSCDLGALEIRRISRILGASKE